MVILSKVFRNTYRDSYLLMKMATAIRGREGVRNAEVMQATEPNKGLLSRGGLLTDEIRDATPNDLFICVVAEDAEKARQAFEQAEEMLEKGIALPEKTQVSKSFNSALAMLPEANLALISIPGPYVKKEALKALGKGLHLFIFSNNVEIRDEIEIKEWAIPRGLLVMGPDCGTGIIHGTALGFANKVRRGPVGLVGASGTGLQEVSVLLHQMGLGISHAIGTGSNDVSDAVGGMTMIQAIQMLEADPATEVIVVVSKPPGAMTKAKVLGHLQQCRKPVVVNFLGEGQEPTRGENILFTVTLEETSRRAAERLKGQWGHDLATDIGEPQSLAEEAKKLQGPQQFLRGLFSGGTLATEAGLILQGLGLSLSGNIALRGVQKLQDARRSDGHTVVDLGADEFTLGKPHPMLEPEMRKERLLAEARDPEVAVILLDFVLGYGVHPDPVGASLSFIQEARRVASAKGRHLSFVASVCGTDEDPQNRSNQVRKLRETGVLVCPSNAQATRAAARLALRS